MSGVGKSWALENSCTVYGIRADSRFPLSEWQPRLVPRLEFVLHLRTANMSILHWKHAKLYKSRFFTNCEIHAFPFDFMNLAVPPPGLRFRRLSMSQRLAIFGAFIGNLAFLRSSHFHLAQGLLCASSPHVFPVSGLLFHLCCEQSMQLSFPTAR